MASAATGAPLRRHKSLSTWLSQPNIILVAVGLFGDLLIACLKFGAADFTASSAMFAEGIHSVMDVMTEVILLYGMAVSRRPATRGHQLGFGREAFFWNFVAALLILAAGSGVTLHDGVRQIVHPRPIDHIGVNFAVLGFAFLVETATTFYASRNGLLLSSGGLFGLFKTSRDPSSLTILFTGFAGLAGVIFASVGSLAALLLDRPWIDGAASICIALIMALAALALAIKCKSLLIGVAASPSAVRSITSIAAAHPAVLEINGAITVHLSAEQLMVGLSIGFLPDLTTHQIEDAVAEIDVALRARHPDIVRFFAKPQDKARYAALKAKRGW